MRALGLIGLCFLGLLGSVLIGLMVWEPFTASPATPPAAKAYQAEILRDQFGVPHISGKTDADVAYGLARAHAEDDFETLQEVVSMTRGRYGAIAGQDGAAIDYALELLGARETAQRDYAKLPADTRAVLEAYATGLNDYADANPGELALSNLFPVNGEDIATGFVLRQPFFFGLNNTLGPLVEGTERNPEFGPKLDMSPKKPAPLAMGEDGMMSGSNAFAIAPERSGDGVTRLVSNSHQPWRGGVAWYEATIESEEGWHFSGATFPGSPYIFLGHNEHLGWTNTVNRPDMVDVYELSVNANGTEYRMDGKWKPLEKNQFWLKVRFGPLVVPVPRTTYRSEHGPVIKNDNGYFAFRYGGMESLGQLDAYYRIGKTKNLDEWLEVMKRQEIPSTNFIYADKEGNIAYLYNASIPDRPTGYDWRGVLKGDISANIWSGLAPFEKKPKYINPSSGFLYNSNNMPFYAAGESDLSPDSVEPELGVELTMTNRAWRAHKLLTATNPIGREELEAIKYDTGYERLDYVADLMDGIAALDVSDDEELVQAQKLLAEWDYNADGVGRGDALALLTIREMMGTRYSNEPDPDMRELLQHAADHLMDNFGRLDIPQSHILRLQQGDVDLPVDGGSDTLRASTLWDIQDDGRLAIRHGDSFIQFVEWEPGKPVRSESIQPYGQAITRPDSPHFSDQSALFVQHKLKPVHFTRADALANAVRRYTVSSR
ncbi:acylase [Altererythrobacter sp. ZODW24]|uniref:acylase n=1 Tax=Altererythrobacter sp. ZODW24 TaxID=2185142 RepID=UPI000DF7EAA2|nr:acylase [Altererythrobacter sp. ZODW24]